MNILDFLVTGCALVVSVLAGSSTPSYKEEKCILPNNQPGPDCKQISLMYFYNSTSGKCQNFRWTGCNYTGVFDTLHECEHHSVLMLPRSLAIRRRLLGGKIGTTTTLQHKAARSTCFAEDGTA
uniref:Putative bpti/kunitz family of serine protease inhibitor n=1 Tax=Amblyomma tuberculatum TaxID=48802 RepID=A0A6M2E595_9ACAR